MLSLCEGVDFERANNFSKRMSVAQNRLKKLVSLHSESRLLNGLCYLQDGEFFIYNMNLFLVLE